MKFPTHGAEGAAGPAAPVLPAIEGYLARSGMRATRFGVLVARDPRLVFDLRRGRRVRPALAGVIGAYLAAARGESGGADSGYAAA